MAANLSKPAVLLLSFAAAMSASSLIPSTEVRAEPPAATTAPTSAPADVPPVLTEKGLVKKGGLFLLPGEIKVTESIKPLMAAKKKFDEDANVRGEFVAKVDKAKAVLADIDLQQRQQNEKLANAKSVRENNEAVGNLNVLKSKFDEAQRYKKMNEEKIASLGDDVRGEYIDLSLTLYGKADETLKRYDELGADPEVKSALGASKSRLGPSPEFRARVAMLKKMAGGFNADTVQVKHEQQVPMVEVTLNGKATRWMVLDSGASFVTLPEDLANELHMVPGDKDPIIRCQLADGKIVEARRMILQSIRLGTFTVENVECAVLPSSLTSAQPLLGGSFLKNFIYKLDPSAQEMHMTRAAPSNGHKPATESP